MATVPIPQGATVESVPIPQGATIDNGGAVSQPDDGKEGFVKAYSGDLKGIGVGILGGISGMAYGGIKKAIGDYKTYQDTGKTADQLAYEKRRSEGHGIAYSATAPITEAVGANVQGMEDAAKKGDVGGVLGHALAVPTVIIATALGGRVASSLRKAQGVETMPEMSKPVAVEKVTQAVVPDPTEAPVFRRNLATHFDTVMEHLNTVLEEQGKSSHKATLDDIAQATRNAADADSYRKSFIDPYKDTTVSTNYIKGYRGATTSGEGGHTATLGQLDSRLSQINDILEPKYTKGGGAANTTLSSPTAQKLSAEASSIRETIAETVAKKTGVDAETIQKGRARWGQLDALAKRVQQTVEENNASKLASKNTPTTVGDVINAGKKVQVNPLNWGTNIPDRLVGDVARRYQPTSDIRGEIQRGGGKFVGVQEGVPGKIPDQALFNTPDGSTLAVPVKEVTSAAVKAKIKASMKQFADDRANAARR